MAESEERVGTGEAPRGSKRAPKSISVVRGSSTKREQRRLKRFEAGGKMEAKKSGLCCVSRMELVGNFNSLIEKLKKVKGNRYSSMVCLPKTQKEMERVTKELERKSFLTERLR